MHRPAALLLCLLALSVHAETADLSITQTASTLRAAPGSALTYTIRVFNSGPDAASTVTMTDVLPPQLQYLSRVITTQAGFSCTFPAVGATGTIACNAARMDPDATMTLRLHVRVAENASFGTVTNVATLASPAADPDDADRTAAADVELVPGADLSIFKRAGIAAVRPGALLDYNLSIQNTGPNAATDVVVTDVLPPDLLFERVQPYGSFTCTAPAAGTNGTVTCTAPSLPASRVGGITVVVRVAPRARPGVVTNTATVASATLDPDQGDTTAAEPVTIAERAGSERRLDSAAAGPRLLQASPDVATTWDNALAVWREGTASIRGALFRPDASAQTLIEFAAPEEGREVAHPVVAAAADRYLVVWRESRSSEGRILARRVRVDGSFLDAAPLVLETGTAIACCPDLGDPRPAVASNGRDFYVTWATASYDVRGMVVPAEGPILGPPSILSREADPRLRSRSDLEVVWTSALYLVVWLDPGLRYARVTEEGVLLDPHTSNSIDGGPEIRSMTATAEEEGAVVTADYDEPGPTPSSRNWCVGVLLFTASGEPGGAFPLRCDDAPPIPAPAIHSTFVPVERGFLLVQPGRRYTPPYTDVVIRTTSLDPGWNPLSDPTSLGTYAREGAVASWRGTALLVYNRTDGDDPATRVPRVFAFFMQGGGGRGRGRVVRH